MPRRTSGLRTGRIRSLIRIGMLLTVIAVRPRWRPLLAAVAFTLLGVIEQQNAGAVMIIPGLMSFWRAR